MRGDGDRLGGEVAIRSRGWGERQDWHRDRLEETQAEGVSVGQNRGKRVCALWITLRVRGKNTAQESHPLFYSQQLSLEPSCNGCFIPRMRAVRLLAGGAEIRGGSNASTDADVDVTDAA